ncbi:MAG: hypothetical protein LR011_09390 [Verrucomicrobia bacterium]|nr:hypothetical protein [Verrucomicrobiota bacterium]
MYINTAIKGFSVGEKVEPMANGLLSSAGFYKFRDTGLLKPSTNAASHLSFVGIQQCGQLPDILTGSLGHCHSTGRTSL